MRGELETQTPRILAISWGRNEPFLNKLNLHRGKGFAAKNSVNSFSAIQRISFEIK